MHRGEFVQPKEFELVPHTADLKIRVFGSTLQELFKHALKGMFSSIKPRGSHISYQKVNRDEEQLVCSKFTVERMVHIIAPNKEQLLVDFLSECLYLSDVHNEAYFDASFSFFSETELQADVYGVPITGFEEVEIKAVTYHDLSLELIDGTWIATIVFDV